MQAHSDFSGDRSVSNAVVGNKMANLRDDITFLLNRPDTIVKMKIQKSHNLI